MVLMMKKLNDKSRLLILIHLKHKFKTNVIRSVEEIISFHSQRVHSKKKIYNSGKGTLKDLARLSLVKIKPSRMLN